MLLGERRPSKKLLPETDSTFRILDIYRSARNIREHWRFRRLTGTYAGSIEVLVHKGFGSSLICKDGCTQANRLAEIHQGQAYQAIQLDVRRVLPGMTSQATHSEGLVLTFHFSVTGKSTTPARLYWAEPSLKQHKRPPNHIHIAFHTSQNKHHITHRSQRGGSNARRRAYLRTDLIR
jgi:hypothetical protein